MTAAKAFWLLACCFTAATADFMRIAINADIVDGSWGQEDLRTLPDNFKTPDVDGHLTDFLKIYHYKGIAGDKGYGELSMLLLCFLQYSILIVPNIKDSGLQLKFKNGLKILSPRDTEMQYHHLNMLIHVSKQFETARTTIT